jgi:hypothetical protein
MAFPNVEYLGRRILLVKASAMERLIVLDLLKMGSVMDLLNYRLPE